MERLKIESVCRLIRTHGKAAERDRGQGHEENQSGGKKHRKTRELRVMGERGGIDAGTSEELRASDRREDESQLQHRCISTFRDLSQNNSGVIQVDNRKPATALYQPKIH